MIGKTWPINKLVGSCASCGDGTALFVDTHCHLDFEQFDSDRDKVVERAETAGVNRIVVPAVDLGNCQKVIKLAERYESIYAAVGVHPNSTAEWQDEWVDAIRELTSHKKVVAIGEIGLDYHWDLSPKETQHRALAAQLELAAELELPVIIHNRKSDVDLLNILNSSSLSQSERPGVLHSFSAERETAEQGLAMGYYIGLTGPITFKKADKLREIAGGLPLERLLIETDAPFLAPQKYRGKRNEPAFVLHVAEQLALLHGLTMVEVAGATTENAVNLFGRKLV